VAGRPAGVWLLADRLDIVELEEAGAEPADPLKVGALRVLLRPGHRQLGLRERRPPLRQTLRTKQPLHASPQLRRARLHPRRATEHSGKLSPPEPVLRGARPPVLTQPDQVDMLLALARLQHRRLRRVI